MKGTSTRLKIKWGLSYRAILGELIYAYVIFRLDKEYAIAEVSKSSS